MTTSQQARPGRPPSALTLTLIYAGLNPGNPYGHMSELCHVPAGTLREWAKTRPERFEFLLGACGDHLDRVDAYRFGKGSQP